MRLVFAACALLLLACAHEDLSLRHGSPLHTYGCEGGKSFKARQLLTGEVEVTAGGKTRDVKDAYGDPIANRPSLAETNGASRLIGFPGGPYEGCTLAEDE